MNINCIRKLYLLIKVKLYYVGIVDMYSVVIYNFPEL